MEQLALDEPTMVDVASTELLRRFPTISPSLIETTARACVHRWCARARVKNFVPIIAGRDARDQLEREVDHHGSAQHA